MRAFVLALALLTASPAFADEIPPETSESAREAARKAPPGYEPVPGGAARAETADANTLVIGAYAAVFMLLFGFVIQLVRKQSTLSEEMRALEDRIAKKS